jgi:hypothetical protein
VLLLILFLVTLWTMAFFIWLLWKWLPPGDEVRRLPQGPLNRL